MNRSCRRRYYNYANLPAEAVEDTCDCVDNNLYAEKQDECDCGFVEEEDNSFPASAELAQSYVPFQTMNKTFTPEVGLQMGTIFPELVSPYEPGQSLAEQQYIKERNEIKGGCNDA